MVCFGAKEEKDMSKGVKGFSIGLLILAAIFFITSLCMASVDNHSVIDEWKSWFPKDQIEETVEVPEQTEEIEEPVEEVTAEDLSVV